MRLADSVEQAQSEAHTDTLTGVANRRAFDKQLVKACNQAYRERNWLSMVMVDLDHFKQVNDLLGHSHGDEVLQKVASCLAEICHREGDSCSRYGGEEFALILTRTNAIGARNIAAKTVAAVEALVIPHPNSSASEMLTVSAGVHSVKPASENPDATVRELQHGADIALFRAKSNGRNCAFQLKYGLVTHEPDSGGPES